MPGVPARRQDLARSGATDTPEHRKSAFGLWDTETEALERLIPGPNPDGDDSKLPLDNCRYMRLVA